MNVGTDGSAFSLVQSWGSLPSTFAVDSTNNAIVSGIIYCFEVKSKNSIGYSQTTNVSRFAAANLPGQPSAPTKVSLLSNTTFITVAWACVSATEVPITNYKLYASHNGGDYYSSVQKILTLCAKNDPCVSNKLSQKLNYTFKYLNIN